MILAGDIGGTKTVIARYEESGGSLNQEAALIGALRSALVSPATPPEKPLPGPRESLANCSPAW
jgi:hypothetical protein